MLLHIICCLRHACTNRRAMDGQTRALRARPWRALLPALLAGVLGATAGASEPLHLPTLPDYDRAAARDLDNRGQAVGQAFRTDLTLPRQAVLWTKRWWKPLTLEALPTLDGFVDGDASAIARSGIPVGLSTIRVDNTSLFRAVIWKRILGQWQAVELEPPPGYTEAIAAHVNSHGKVVGWAFNPGEIVNGDVVRQAVIWMPSHKGAHTAVPLQPPEGFQSTATGITELGDVVGTAYRTEVGDTGEFLRSDVVVWRRGARHYGLHHRSHHGCLRKPVVLPSLPGLPENRAPAINLFGHVIAAAEALTNDTLTTRPIFWKRRHWRKGGPAYEDPVALPVPEGFTDASATDINVTGKVVGTAAVREGFSLVGSRAVVWAFRRHSGWKEELLTSPEGATFVFGTRLNDVRSVVGNDIRPPAGSTGALLWKRQWPWHRKRHK